MLILTRKNRLFISKTTAYWYQYLFDVSILETRNDQWNHVTYLSWQIMHSWIIVKTATSESVFLQKKAMLPWVHYVVNPRNSGSWRRHHCTAAWTWLPTDCKRSFLALPDGLLWFDYQDQSAAMHWLTSLVKADHDPGYFLTCNLPRMAAWSASYSNEALICASEMAPLSMPRAPWHFEKQHIMSSVKKKKTLLSYVLWDTLILAKKIGWKRFHLCNDD